MLLAAYPQLFVRDIDAACAFYAQKLGFTTVFKYGRPAFYGQVRRDGATLNLRHVDAPVLDAKTREREVWLSAYVPVTDIDAIFAEYADRDVDFQERLIEKPWGVREFVVRDPDGNLICFGKA
jgi:catechol 2,3-dioxygenase-like lactoylglutathione lyase family enzyme